MKKIFLFSLLFLLCSQGNNLYSSEINGEEIPDETNGDSDYEDEVFETEDDDTKLKDIYASLSNCIDNDNFRRFEQILQSNPNIDLNAPFVFRQYTLLQYLNTLKFSKYRDAFIKSLYESGARPEGIHKKYPKPDPTGKTQLMLAIINKDKKRVNELLQSPLEIQFINHQDKEGNTAFHYDVFTHSGSNSSGNINRFYQTNADDTIKNNNGRTVKDMLDH